MRKINFVLGVLLISVSCVFLACQKNEEQVSIKVAHWDVTTHQYVTPLIEAFKLAYPNISIEVIDIPSADYTQRLTVMLNGGSDVDVFWIKDGDTTKSIANRGQLADLSNYVRQDKINLNDFHGVADRFIFDNKLTALPASTGYYVLYYNKDIFDNMGIPYPSNDMTWAEWEILAGRLTSGSGNNKIYGGLLHTWQACVQNWGIQDGRHTIMETEYSFFRPYYEMALRLQRSGHIMDYGTMRAGGLHYSSLFLRGSAATLPMGTWFFTNVIERIANNESNIRWGISTLPHPSNTERGWTVGSVTPIAMNQASRNKDLAWKFISFITGIEGAKIYASYGQFPGRTNDETLNVIASLPGMPEGSAQALAVRNIALDRPMELKVGEINQMLGEEHSLIMLGEISIQRGLENMARRSREIQGK
ncbi:MAG: extracellular solute-binding protein [Treponema sp.]|nr:extracellular solute-binding protein [Treponema sp.]